MMRDCGNRARKGARGMLDCFQRDIFLWRSRRSLLACLRCAFRSRTRRECECDCGGFAALREVAVIDAVGDHVSALSHGERCRHPGRMGACWRWPVWVMRVVAAMAWCPGLAGFAADVRLQASVRSVLAATCGRGPGSRPAAAGRGWVSALGSKAGELQRLRAGQRAAGIACAAALGPVSRDARERTRPSRDCYRTLVCRVSVTGELELLAGSARGQCRSRTTS